MNVQHTADFAPIKAQFPESTMCPQTGAPTIIFTVLDRQSDSITRTLIDTSVAMTAGVVGAAELSSIERLRQKAVDLHNAWDDTPTGQAFYHTQFAAL